MSARIQELEERILDCTATEAEQLEFDELSSEMSAERTLAKPAQTVAEWKGTKHTPGPWQYVPFGQTHLIQRGDDTKTVAVVSPNRDEVQANARLIASAPCLLEALEFLLGDPFGLAPGARDRARAAIAKARGE